MPSTEKRTVPVKWNGKLLENIKAGEGESIEAVKRIIEEQFSIPSKKQKLLFKGRMLKETDLVDAGMLEGTQPIMLLGTAGAVDVDAHLKRAVEESVKQNDSSVSASAVIPVGLKNLGNTCYVNASLQVLQGLNERLALVPSSRGEDSDPLFDSFLALLQSSKTKESAYAPLDFILKLRSRFPQYAEKNDYGLYIQHDVHEFWTCFWSFVSSTAKCPDSLSISLERAAEEVSFEESSCLLLPISGETSSLDDCLRLAFSPSEDGPSGSRAKLSIACIPRLLPFAFMRFMWKSADKVQAKILKHVSYPRTFDVLPFVNAALSKEIQAKRQTVPNFGRYRLEHVITHTGREADSGHYMAWSKHRGAAKQEDWVKFDDDDVSLVKEEEVMRLSGGGGDRPTAYIVFYLPDWQEGEGSKAGKTSSESQ